MNRLCDPLSLLERAPELSQPPEKTPRALAAIGVPEEAAERQTKKRAFPV